MPSASIVVKSWDGAVVNLGGLYSDKENLPTNSTKGFENMATGSNAFLAASDGFHYLEYERTTNKWYE